jgi:hypothetical protein
MSDPVNNPQVQQLASEWEKLVSNQVSHLESFFSQMSTLESLGASQLLGTWEAAGRAARESLAQIERVSGEWRKLAIEATRRTTQTATPKQA